MKLTDPIIKASKPSQSPYKLSDGNGLLLLINPNGSRWWRWRYRYNGKEKMLSLGTYPKVTLKEARNLRVTFSKLLDQGIDPSQHKQEQKQTTGDNFQSIAMDWWNNWKTNKTERHAGYTLRRLESDVFPEIGSLPIKKITAPDLLRLVKKIQSRGAIDIAKRALNTCNQIFRYSVAHGLTDRNPAADIKPSDVLQSTVKKNYARIEQKDLPELLTKINKYDGQPLTKLALKLMVLTFVRTSELRGARWDEIELDNKLWRIPAERMKMRTPHIVPLSNQAIVVVQCIQKYSSHSEFLFPGERNPQKPMSNNTLLYALYRMGYHSRMTGHGFRGLASTILHEQGYEHHLIELQLAHAERNAVSAAYNHATYLEPRKKLMQHWADYLESLGLVFP